MFCGNRNAHRTPLTSEAVQTVLVVDPTADVRETVIAAIDVSKTRLQLVELESEAWDTLRRRTVISVVVNIDSRPDEKLALIESIRCDRRTRHMHIVAISDARNLTLLARSLNAGVSDYMSRPIHPDELVKRFQWATSMARVDRKHSHAPVAFA